MGTLIVLGVIVLGVFMGTVLFSLLSMAKKTEQIYDRMFRGNKIGTLADPYHRPGAETLSPTSRDEARLQRDLSESVAAP